MVEEFAGLRMGNIELPNVDDDKDELPPRALPPAEPGSS